jgi:dGTPase
LNTARASYAVSAAASRGRLVPEPPSPTRSPWQRDRDRIVHSTAFRRLAHKTQVFVPFEGDHFRTRLTHTIEVAQIARAFARGLGLDDDLAEALALAHDLGHTPFGHTGEDVLHALMAPWGGFDHNVQALRIVTRLEHRYAAFDGLNLTWETLEGLVKHNGPLAGPHARPNAPPVPRAVLDFDRECPLDLTRFASAEAQTAAIADDVAYNSHDIDDGLRAGLFDLAALRDSVPLVDDLLREIATRHSVLEPVRMQHELVRGLITLFVEDVLSESARRLRAPDVRTVEDIRAAATPVIAMSARFQDADRTIKGFLFPSMYRHRDVVRVREIAAHVLQRLFPALLETPENLPADWAAAAAMTRDEAARARVVCDYIAGMTDRFALGEYRRLFGKTVDLK